MHILVQTGKAIVGVSCQSTDTIMSIKQALQRTTNVDARSQTLIAFVQPALLDMSKVSCLPVKQFVYTAHKLHLVPQNQILLDNATLISYNIQHNHMLYMMYCQCQLFVRDVGNNKTHVVFAHPQELVWHLKLKIQDRNIMPGYLQQLRIGKTILDDSKPLCEYFVQNSLQTLHLTSKWQSPTTLSYHISVPATLGSIQVCLPTQATVSELLVKIENMLDRKRKRSNDEHDEHDASDLSELLAPRKRIKLSPHTVLCKSWPNLKFIPAWQFSLLQIVLVQKHYQPLKSVLLIATIAPLTFNSALKKKYDR